MTTVLLVVIYIAFIGLGIPDSLIGSAWPAIHTNYFDKWNINELSPYFEVEKDFAKDFVSGGLYGPVAIYTE